jgi:hypothetical protein
MLAELTQNSIKLAEYRQIVTRDLPQLETRNARVQAAYAALKGMTVDDVEAEIALLTMGKRPANPQDPSQPPSEKKPRAPWGSKTGGSSWFTDDQIIEMAAFLQDQGTKTKAKTIYQWAIRTGLINEADCSSAKSFAFRLIGAGNREGLIEYDEEEMAWGTPDHFSNTGQVHAARIAASRAINGSHERVEPDTHENMNPDALTPNVPDRPYQPEAKVYTQDLSRS